MLCYLILSYLILHCLLLPQSYYRNALNDHNNVATSTSLLENTRYSPYPPGVDGTVQLIPLSIPLSVPIPVPVQLTFPVEGSIRKRSGSGEAEGSDKRKSLRGSMAIIKGKITIHSCHEL